jgi:hypothetical protein
VQDSKGNAIDHTQATVEQFMDADTLFAGTPDDVYNQIKAFNDRIGGFGHLLFFGQDGFLDHKDTMDNIRLFGSEVMPRLRELSPATERTTSAAPVQPRNRLCSADDGSFWAVLRGAVAGIHPRRLASTSNTKREQPGRSGGGKEETRRDALSRAIPCRVTVARALRRSRN